jgi:hypothetical protein
VDGSIDLARTVHRTSERQTLIGAKLADLRITRGSLEMWVSRPVTGRSKHAKLENANYTTNEAYNADDDDTLVEKAKEDGQVTGRDVDKHDVRCDAS